MHSSTASLITLQLQLILLDGDYTCRYFDRFHYPDSFAGSTGLSRRNLTESKGSHRLGTLITDSLQVAPIVWLLYDMDDEAPRVLHLASSIYLQRSFCNNMAMENWQFQLPHTLRRCLAPLIECPTETTRPLQRPPPSVLEDDATSVPQDITVITRNCSQQRSAISAPFRARGS